jgi:hypothetical protein
MTETRSFIIPASNQTMVEEQLEKLNKRANKLGLDPISITWEKAFTDCKDNLLVPCNLTGPVSISYDGWEFIATLQHLPTGENIIRAITDDCDIPVEYRTAGSDCQHCNSKRYRKDTYVVRRQPAIYKQVGSSCIKDFLGGNSPDNILQRASFIGELISFMKGAGTYNGARDEGVFHIVKFLAHTSAIIQKYGWISKNKAYESGEKSTASRVLDNLNDSFLEIDAIDLAKAKLAIEWSENLSDEECNFLDYLFNIRAIVRSGMVGFRAAGFAASIISSFNRASIKLKPPTISSYVGLIKNRDTFDLYLKKIFTGVSDYGQYYKFIFNDELGNVLVWTSSVSQNLEEGKRYLIKGTIKSHTEFRSVKQTNLSRCELLTTYECVDESYQ